MDMRYTAWAGYDLTECVGGDTTSSGCTLVIWNGTGTHDSDGDWNRTGHGFEAEYAKYEGTYGLDATSFTNNEKIYFRDTNDNNVDEYDFLSMYINLKEWPSAGEATISFEDGNSVLLSNYLKSLNLDSWQRILVPLADFGLTAPINLSVLTITSLASIGFYLDNVEFAVGVTDVVAIDTGKPDMEADNTNKPSMKASGVDFRPAMRAFTPPTNL